MKILLLGASGQVGFELQRCLAPLGEVTPATRSGRLPGGASCLAADLADPGSLAAALDSSSADLVVNAAAWTAVDRAESEAEAARRTNAEAVAEIAQWCAVRGAGLVHYSTDYVFGAGDGAPYREDAQPAPLGVYGRTKLEGEQAIRAAAPRHLILRTAWVYAARGQNFLRTMLRVGAERDSLRVVDDQRGSPTPARLIAATTAAMLARRPDASGSWHLVAGGDTSWHGFASAIFEGAASAGLLPRVPSVAAIPTSAYPTPAKRPADSRLDTSALARDFGLVMPHWREGLAQVLAELAERG